MILDLHRECTTINNFNLISFQYNRYKINRKKQMCGKKKACKQKLSELKKYENIIKKTCQ